MMKKPQVKDWNLKVFSLLVSVVLFLFVNLQSGTSVNVEFPIEYRTADDIMLVADTETTLIATMKGPWASFRSFADVPPVVIDLREKLPGPVLFRLSAGHIRTPAGMEVLSFRPYQLEIELDRRVEKLVAVEVDPLGRPGFGFEIADMHADPPRVRVEGPMSKMRTLDFVHTRPVDLRDREDDLSIEVELRPPLQPLRLTERKAVMVFVDISEEFSQRNFELPVRLVGAPSFAKVTPRVVLVTIKGPRRVVDGLDAKTLEAVVDVEAEMAARLKRFEKTIALSPELPDRAQILGGAPKVGITIPRRHRRR